MNIVITGSLVRAEVAYTYWDGDLQLESFSSYVNSVADHNSLGRFIIVLLLTDGTAESLQL